MERVDHLRVTTSQTAEINVGKTALAEKIAVMNKITTDIEVLRRQLMHRDKMVTAARSAEREMGLLLRMERDALRSSIILLDQERAQTTAERSAKLRLESMLEGMTRKAAFDAVTSNFRESFGFNLF